MCILIHNFIFCRKTDLQDLQYELEKRDKESKEMEEFLTFERDMKNDSIMYHQVRCVSMDVH